MKSEKVLIRKLSSLQVEKKESENQFKKWTGTLLERYILHDSIKRLEGQITILKWILK